jgi:hypothetical protein
MLWISMRSSKTAMATYELGLLTSRWMTALIEQRLRVVGQELRPVEHLRGLRDLPVDAQTEPVEDVAGSRPAW